MRCFQNLYVTHNHGSSPEKCDGRQEDPWANLPEDHRRWWLEEHVRDEEYQCDNIISFTNQFQLHGHTSTSVSAFFEERCVPYPAIAADPRFVLSIKLAQYRIPRVETRRRSTFFTIRFCSSGLYSDKRVSFELADTVCSTWSPFLDFSRSSWDMAKGIQIDALSIQRSR